MKKIIMFSAICLFISIFYSHKTYTKDAVDIFNDKNIILNRENLESELLTFDVKYISSVIDGVGKLQTKLKSQKTQRGNKIPNFYYLHKNKIYVEKEHPQLGWLYLVTEIKKGRYTIENTSYDAVVCIMYLEKFNIMLTISFGNYSIASDPTNTWVSVIGDISTITSRLAPNDPTEETIQKLVQLMIFDKFLQ